MTSFTVETAVAPVTNGDWSQLRQITDLLPGTLLLEDPDEPMLIIPVEAEDQRSAALSVHGAMNVLGQEIRWGRAYRSDHITDSAEHVSGAHIAPDWLEDPEATNRRRELADA